MENNIYMTVLCNDQYAGGVLALCESVRRTKTQIPFAVLCAPAVGENTKEKLRKCMLILEADDISVSNEILTDNIDEYQKWNTTFFKLNVFKQTQFDKIILLDADMIILKNIDHLFSRQHMSAVPSGKLIRGKEKYGLNSGLIVLQPSEVIFSKMVNAIGPTKLQLNNHAIGDQDVIKYVYSDWMNQDDLELSETYNCFSHEMDELCARKMLSFKDIYVIHFASKKPWNTPFKKHLIRSLRNRNSNTLLLNRAIFEWWWFYYLACRRTKM